MNRHAPILMTVAVLGLGLVPSRSEILGALKDSGPNRHDVERMERGYYEQLLDSGRRLGTVEPAPFDAGRLCNVVTDLREYVLKPNMKTTHRGASWTTNSLGMRDREYVTTKPPGTVRIALVGDSIGSGWGVEDGEPFESLIEGRLNDLGRGLALCENAPPVARPVRNMMLQNADRVEVLNFSVPGHAPGQRWEQFHRVGWSMSPDIVIFEATPADPGWDERRLRGLLARNVGWDAPQYRDAISASKAPHGGNFETYKSTLKPHRWAILENVYRNAVAECRERKVVPVWVLIPRVGKPISVEDRHRLVGLARSAGFGAIIDLSDAFDGIEPAELAIGPEDFHPNARGHRLLADALEQALDTILMGGKR